MVHNSEEQLLGWLVLYLEKVVVFENPIGFFSSPVSKRCQKAFCVFYIFCFAALPLFIFF